MKEKATRPKCSIRLRAMRWFLGSVLEEANKLPLHVTQGKELLPWLVIFKDSMGPD